jgi:ABC-type transport system involved in multi-copper enzyme maturation permease subunit
MLFFTVLPTLFLAIPFFLYEQASQDEQRWRFARGFLTSLQKKDELNALLPTSLKDVTPEQIQDSRRQVWSFLLLTLFRYPQALLMVLVIGIAAPPLISNDVRSRAFLIYFSRPITRLEYILGKMGTMVFFLGMITTLPAMLLYGVGVMLSPDLDVLWSTWDLPLRILLASLMLILPTCSMALMMSSMTSESRYAGFAWFAVWILGIVTYGFTTRFGEVLEPGWRILLSPYHTLGVVQAWVFDLNTDESMLVPAAVVLSLVTVVSLAILYHRVSSPMRA